jgi:hypothetical protein
MLHWLSRSFLPPPHLPFYLPEMWGELIYTECRGIIPQYTVLLSLCLVTQWFLHHHFDLQLHLPFFSYPETEKVELSFGCHYASFQIRSLRFLELFPNFPLSVFGCLSQGPVSHLTITRTIRSEWIRAWWPPRVSLALSAFGHLCQGPASRLTVWGPSDLSVLNQNSPPWPIVNSPLSVSFG